MNAASIQRGLWMLVGCIAAMALAVDASWAATLTGRVVDERGQPMIGVNIMIPDLQRGGMTDEKGVFRIADLPAGTYTVQIRFIGYKRATRAVTLSTGVTTIDDVRMEVEPLQAEPVTVTGKRDLAGELTGTSQSVAVLDPEKLEALRGQTLGETLEALPGVTAMTTGPAVSKPVVRGLHSQRVLVLNAGVTQEGQQWGGDHAPEIDPFAPARIEVLKGAAGVQYGAGAIGGVVRVDPAPLHEDPGIGGRLSLNSFSNNRQGAGSLMIEGGSRRIRGLGWRVQGSFRRAGDAQTPTHIIRNSGFDERDWSVALGLNRDRAGVEAYFSHFGTELGIFRDSHIGNVTDLERAIERGEPQVGGDFTYAINPPKQGIDHDLLSVRSRYRINGAGTLQVNYGQQYNRRKEWDAHKNFSSDAPTTPAFDLGLQSHSADIVLQHRPLGRWYGKIGVSGMRQKNTRFSTGFLIPDYLTYNWGGFVLESWTNDRWTFDVGARFDYRWLEVFPNESNRESERVIGRTHTYSNVSGAAGAVYRLSSSWAVGANIGQAWRPPGVNELYSSGVHHGSAQYEQGDLNLESERSLNTDVTLRYLSERGRGELSVYHTRFKNFITLFPDRDFVLTIRGAFPSFSYVQSDARLQGFDGFVEYDLTRYFTMNASASVIRSRDLDNDEPLFLIAPDRLIAGAEFHFPAYGRLLIHSLNADIKLVRRQDNFPQGADFTDPPEGYRLVDMAYDARMPFGDHLVRLRFGVHNLFNVQYRDYLSRYRYFIDDPGRNVALRVSIPFGDYE